MKFNQVVVVEGRHDIDRLKKVYPELECIATNGSEISDETIKLIYETSKIKEVILFLDPDFPGKRITDKILETKGQYKIAFLNKQKAMSKNNSKVGIEHANFEDIQKALDRHLFINYNTDKISYLDLYKRKLINHPQAFELRKNICEKLEIPVANGKTFLKYLNMLGIELERVDKIIYES